MTDQDKKTVAILRETIREVKEEMKSGKVLAESKANKTKEEGLYEYITKSITNIIAESE